MTAVDNILRLCKERKVRISKLEQDCGFSNGYIKKNRDRRINPERIKVIANYFGVPYSEIDPDTFAVTNSYYINPETAETAQELLKNSEMRILFDAAKDSKPEDLLMAAQLLKRLKETNPDG